MMMMRMMMSWWSRTSCEIAPVLNISQSLDRKKGVVMWTSTVFSKIRKEVMYVQIESRKSAFSVQSSTVATQEVPKKQPSIMHAQTHQRINRTCRPADPICT